MSFEGVEDVEKFDSGDGQNKINMFLATNAKFFTAAQLADLRNRITELDDSLLMYTSQLKDPTTALILSIFTGGLGIDRFYIGDTGLGIGKLLTGGGCGIWSLIDWFLIMDDTRNKNYQIMMNAIMMHGQV